MEIRDAEPPDAEALAAVHIASWQRAYRGLLPDDYLDGLEQRRWTVGWRRVLAEESPGATVLAETATSAVVGFADVRPTRDDDAGGVPTGEVTSIYVSPDAWGTGVGRRLMDEAVRRLRAAGYRHATLWVLHDNARARRFYELAGWAVDGSEKPAVVAGVAVTEVRYRRTL